MYVTRRLSHYIKHPDALLTAPEGPNSGYLVLQDEESETYCCFGLCKSGQVMDLPIPQNKDLTIRFSSGSGEHRHTSHDDLIFIPVLNLPLSSNRYYAIQPHGSHIGEAFTSSKDEDMGTCCFTRYVRDVKPRPQNPHDMYQQFEICVYETACSGKGRFYARSLAEDGFPPYILRRKGWEINTKTPRTYELTEALGVNSALRARLPEFNIPVLSNKMISSRPVSVGRWYCPFLFVKEGTLREQIKRSMYYEMTLEQKWEQIFYHENQHKELGNHDVLSMDVAVQREVVYVDGREAHEAWDERRSNVVSDGAIWFTSINADTGKETRVGLKLEIVQRMKWEEERAGWMRDEGRQVRVKRELDKFGEGTKYGCYVLVERFVLKRMDGSLVMTYDFKHTHQIKTKYE